MMFDEEWRNGVGVYRGLGLAIMDGFVAGLDLACWRSAQWEAWFNTQAYLNTRRTNSVRQRYAEEDDGDDDE